MAHTQEPWCYMPEHGRGDVYTPKGDVIAYEVQHDDGYLIIAAPHLRRFAQEIAALEPQDFDAHMGETLIRRARALVVKADGAT